MTAADLETLADEYVVGLLDDAETAAADRRLLDDDDFADAVAIAQERFLEVDLTEPAGPVAADGWRRIERRLDAPANAPDQDDETILPFQQPAQPTATQRPPGGPWKATALAAMAASLLLALGLGWQITRPAPLVIAVLLDADGDPNLLIEAFADDRARIVPLSEIAIPSDRTLEVWTLPDVPDAKPVSLGRLDVLQTRHLQGPDLPTPQQGQLYEITMEPAGGSPTGLPTGPVIGKGFAKPAL